MIAFMPKPYDDELVYSWFARYYVRTGYVYYKSVAEDLFARPMTKVSWDFFVKLTDDAVKMINRYMTIEEMIVKHTMFPQYAKFLSADRKKSEMGLLLKTEGKFGNRFYRKKSTAELRKFFRYCPLCVKEDREKWGETYWHRKHHIDGIDVCAVHGCRLEDSILDTTGKAKGDLVSAESIIPAVVIPDWKVKDIEVKVAQYVAMVFECDIDMEADIEVSDFFDYKLANTEYRSSRGTLRRTEKLFFDFMEFYDDLDNNPIQDKNRLRRIFTNENFQMYEICLLGLFLGIPVSELCKMKYGVNTQAKEFDESVMRLKEKGLSNREVAMVMNTKRSAVKVVAANFNRKREVAYD